MLLRTAVSIALALLCAGCFETFTSEKPSPLAATAGAMFCQVAKPIYWSANDTRETKEQVDTHNRKGAALCGWGGKKK